MLSKHVDDHLVHVDRLHAHPRQGGEDGVMQEDGHGHTARHGIGSLRSQQKEHVHQQHGHAQAQQQGAGAVPTQVPENKQRFPITGTDLQTWGI